MEPKEIIEKTKAIQYTHKFYKEDEHKFLRGHTILTKFEVTTNKRTFITDVLISQRDMFNKIIKPTIQSRINNNKIDK